MHVEEHDAVAFADRRAVDAGERSARGVDRARGDVSRDDGVRNAREAAVPEMHVGPAHLGSLGSDQCGAVRQIRTRKRSELDRRAWRGHHRREDIGHAVYVIL